MKPSEELTVRVCYEEAVKRYTYIPVSEEYYHQLENDEEERTKFFFEQMEKINRENVDYIRDSFQIVEEGMEAQC